MPPKSAHPRVSIKHINESKGRGIVANMNIHAGSALLAVRPDIAVLYSPFAGQLCAACYLPADGTRGASTSSSASDSYACPTCDQFVLCPACVTAMAEEAVPGIVGSRGTTPTMRLLRHPTLQAHQLACAWYNELPSEVRAPGNDTDFLRFCLMYGARLMQGDTALASALGKLTTNAEVQSPETISFCEGFAKNKIIPTFAQYPRGKTSATCSTPRYAVDADNLRDTLLRVRCNSLGFPFTEDEVTGWSMQEEMCMLNHSCEPNAAVVCAWAPEHPPLLRAAFAKLAAASNSMHPALPRLEGFMGLKALRDIPKGEEVTISYIDLESCSSNVQARKKFLWDQYRFKCSCPRCRAQSQR